MSVLTRLSGLSVSVLCSACCLSITIIMYLIHLCGILANFQWEFYFWLLASDGTLSILSIDYYFLWNIIRLYSVLEFGLQLLNSIYITISTFASVRPSAVWHPSHFQISDSCSRIKNITNKSCLVCVKSEKYPFWVTLRPLGSKKQGETKLGMLF